MKTINNLFKILGFLILTNPAFGQTLERTTLVTSLNPGSFEQADIHLSGDFVINKWDENHIRIVINIDHNASKKVIKALTRVGRYKVQAEKNISGMVVFTMPAMAKKVVLDNIEFNEILSYEIFLPSHIKIVQNQSLVTN